jgi:hypothetical protein
MNKKSPAEQINLASMNLMTSAKDAVTTNIMTAVRAKQVDVKHEQLEKLLLIVNASVEEGYQRGFRFFTHVVNTALADAVLPPLTKKKA